MKKIFLSATLLILLPTCMLLLFNSSPKAEEQAVQSFPKKYIGSNDGYAFVIFFTGDVKGNFEPCG